MQGSTSKQNCLAARASPVTGVSRIDTASCMTGSAAFQTSSILSDTTARSKQGFLRRPRVSPIASKERTSMVDFQYPPGERQSNTPTILREEHNVGRVKAGLGCCMWSSDNKGQLVLTGTFVSHKHLRAQSSLSCDPIISQAQDKYINKAATRQYNRSLLHQQQRRHSLTRVDGSDNGVVDVVSQQKYLHSSRASARSTELPASTPETLKNPIDPTMTHPMFPRLHLAVWLVSSNRARQSAFRNTLPDFSQPLFANPLTRPMIHHGENGIAGVIDGKLIQFQRV